jgi:hypothetical protein
MELPQPVNAECDPHPTVGPCRRLRRGGHRRSTGLLLALLVLAVACGCVRRRLTVRSDPPGAMVSVDQQEIGVTPVSVPFTYYGTRNFVVSRDRYETAAASRTFHPPWYEWPGLDFLSENLWPFEVRDERVVEFQLQPKQLVQPDKLMRRAGDLRDSARSGVVAPVPTPSSGPPTSPLPPTQRYYPGQGLEPGNMPEFLPPPVPTPDGPITPPRP